MKAENEKLMYYTHAGLFHADEVFGFAICTLSQVAYDFKRLQDLTPPLPNDGILADIGREYDSKNRYDHHQGFIVRDNGYPLATAGLLWRHFGYDAIHYSIEGMDEKEIEAVVELVDEKLIQGIDAHDADNKYTVSANCFGGEVKVWTVSNVISAYNHAEVNNHEIQRVKFRLAAKVAERVIFHAIKSALERVRAEKRFSQIAEIESGIAILSEQLPWKEIIHEKHPDVYFVISWSNHPGSKYSMIAVPIHPETRALKKTIERPNWFDGFIHEGKWIAGSNDIEALIELAKYNL